MNLICETPPLILAYGLHPAAVGRPCLLVLKQPATATSLSFGAYLSVFALTLLLESPFYWHAVRGRTLAKLKALFVCNLATHPAVCFGIPSLMAYLGATYGTSLGISEVFAPVTEAIMMASIWRVGWRRAVVFSFAANLFSWWVGIYAVNWLPIFS